MREPAQTVPTEMMVPMPAEPAELPQTPGDEQPSDAAPFTDQPSAPAGTYKQPTAGQSGSFRGWRSAVTIFDLATRVKRLTECLGEIAFTPLTYTDVELRIPNVDKARSLIGFEAKVDLDEGLERTIAWYRSRLAATA